MAKAPKGRISPPPTPPGIVEYDPRKPEIMFQAYLASKERGNRGAIRLKVLMDTLYSNGKAGSEKSIEILLAYALGRPKQRTEHSGEIAVNDERKNVVQRFMQRALTSK